MWSMLLYREREAVDAEIIVRYVARDLCDEKDLERWGITFEQMVREMVESEGIWGIAEDEGEVISIRRLEEGE